MAMGWRSGKITSLCGGYLCRRDTIINLTSIICPFYQMQRYILVRVARKYQFQRFLLLLSLVTILNLVYILYW